MKKTIGTFMMLAVLATSCTEAEKPQKYEANWDSLKKYEVPEWWKNAKFGIYFHWDHILSRHTKQNGTLIGCTKKAIKSESTTKKLMET